MIHLKNPRTMFTFVRQFQSCGLCVLVMVAALSGRAARAGGLEEVAAFSEVRDIDMETLASGKAVMAQGVPMSGFPRGASVQAVYLVPLSLQKTVELHRQFNAAKHPELKVYLHRELPAKPSLSDFQVLIAAPGNSAVRALGEATLKLDPEQPELQMSAGEARLSGEKPSGGSGKGPFPPGVANFWSNLLYHRTVAYVAGGLSKQPAYNASGETIRPSEEVSRLLKSQSKVRDQFKPLLDEASIMSGGGKASLFFELFDVEHRAALTLGASYSKPLKESWQTVDVQYYSSGGYFALLTFYQFWPVKTASGTATLVWRGDMLSSASLADLHGMERTGSIAAMKKEIQKNIGVLQSDARH